MSWDDIERAEARLDQRAGERARARTRRRRMATAARWLLTLIAPIAGSAAFTAIVESAGGDFRGWPDREVIAVIVATTLIPALLVGWLWRRHGVLVAVPAALAVAAAEVGLVFGVAFAALGYGPD